MLELKKTYIKNITVGISTLPAFAQYFGVSLANIKLIFGFVFVKPLSVSISPVNAML